MTSKRIRCHVFPLIWLSASPLVQALVLIYSSLGIFGLLLGDLLMVICDPRIKLVREKENR